MDNFLTLKGGEVDVGGAPQMITILPLGHVKSQKGEFDVDTESFEAMKRQLTERGVDLVIDYEHQTLKGVQAPAAGWVKELILSSGGISARVEWTPAAEQYLKNREYRYLSPVISVRKSDNKATGLHSAALTNTPAIDGMTPIVNSLKFEMEDDTMEFLKQLAALLGLGEDAAEEQIVEALTKALAEATALKDTAPGGGAPGTQADTVIANKGICTALGLSESAPAEEIAASILALKASAPASVDYEQKVLKLEAQLASRDAEDTVLVALKAGKISAAQSVWAKSYALKDPEGFADYVKNAPQVVPIGELDFETKALKSDVPAPETLRACKLIGVSDEDLKKYGRES